jgi:hypothetical protein
MPDAGRRKRAGNPIAQSAWRAPHGTVVLDAASDTLRTVVVRPGVVYGGSRGIVGDLLRCRTGRRVIGNGDNHWPLVCERDLGELYSAATTPEASASTTPTTKATSGERSRRGHCRSRENPPSVRRVPLTEARKKMGAHAEALALDQLVRSPRARAIGWHPSLHSVAGNAARLVEEWRRGREAA